MKRLRWSVVVIAVVAATVAAPAEASTPPRNGLIVFERFYEEANGPTFLWTMNPNGTDQHRLTAGESPRWSPDGSRIAFDRYVDADRDYFVFVMSADGTNIRRIARGGSATWSSDGTELAYGHDGNLYVSRLGSASPPRLVGPGYGPDWGVNNRLAYLCVDANNDWQICTSAPDGTSKRQLTHSVWNWEPRWSPDATRIAFASSRPVYCCFFDLLYIINADGTGERRLSRGLVDEEEDTSPTWSPDGTMLLFSTSRGYAGGSGHELATMNPETGCGINYRTRTDVTSEFASDWRARH